MTTLTEIVELKAEMDAKFDRVFAQIADLHSEMNGFRHDMDEGFADINRKLDLLLRAHGLDDNDAAAA